VKACAAICIAILLLAMAACSGNQSPSANGALTSAAQSQYLAIARGRVDVEGGLARVVAQRDGILSALDAQEGDEVKAGQVLAQLDARGAQLELAGMKAQVNAARAQLAELEVKLREARKRAPRVAAAAKAGAASGDTADEAREAVASLQAQRDAAKAALDLAQQRVAQAQFEVDARTLRAPVAGRVVRRIAQIGQTVSAQSPVPLFEILPDRPRIVRAELDADDADKIQPGMDAQVVRETGEGTTYAAKVLRVGEVLGSDTLSDDPLARAASREVDCVLRLEPDAKAPPLRIGERVLVRFPRAGNER